MKINALGLILILLGLSAGSSAQTADYTIRHLEPPCWWVGMKNPALQLMIHGNGIGDLQPVILQEGVVIDSVARTNNRNYLFIYLNISKKINAGSFDIRFQKDGKTELSYNYSLLERRPNSAIRKSFSNADVICLITPDRFANGDPENDNSPLTLERASRSNKNRRHGGDIRGVIEHLDYITDMGFTAIWLNPVLENNQPAYSYHGYSITDFYRTDPRFGSNETYLELSRKAHFIGLKLIMDQVMNHCGSGHWWMSDLPSQDWLRTTENYGPTNHLRTTITDPYASAKDRDMFVKGAFVPTMPDMNQDNPHLACYLIQNSIWWIEYADLDGIRHDTHSYAGAGFMSDWACSILNEYPDFNIVGEEWSLSPAIVSRWQRGYKGNANLASCLPSLMDFPLQMAVSQALGEDETWSGGFTKMYEMLANDFLYPDPFNLVVFPDNHDMTRFYTQIGENPGRFKLGMVFFLTTRGIPQIYYGSEILMTSPYRRDDGLVRSDFPGGWANDTVNAFTGKGLTSLQAETQAFMKTLLNWRKSAPVIHSGKLLHYAPANGVYVYFRYDERDQVMVILNKNKKQIDINVAAYPEMLTHPSRFRDILTGKEFSPVNLSVPAESALILEVR
ncbi:MAG: glycoside hydrolase family 13 protein [Bacteroidota bacterium]